MLRRSAAIPSTLKIRHRAFWLTPSAFHCGSKITARRPRAGNHRRGEAQEPAPLVLGLLLGRLAAGVKQFDLAMLDAKVRRCLVGVELVTVGDDVIVEGRPEFQHRGLVGAALRRIEILQSRPALCPLQTPLERTHHAIVVARGHARLPVVHPSPIVFSHLRKLYRSERGAVARNPMNMRVCTLNGAQGRLSGNTKLPSKQKKLGWGPYTHGL